MGPSENVLLGDLTAGTRTAVCVVTHRVTDSEPHNVPHKVTRRTMCLTGSGTACHTTCRTEPLRTCRNLTFNLVSSLQLFRTEINDAQFPNFQTQTRQLLKVSNFPEPDLTSFQVSNFPEPNSTSFQLSNIPNLG